jgi:hypothetical protein
MMSASVTARTWTIVEPEEPLIGASAVQARVGGVESTPTLLTLNALGSVRRTHPTELPPEMFVAVRPTVVAMPSVIDDGVLAMVQPPVAARAKPDVRRRITGANKAA